jgi:SAM-dependent methyltransferase
VADGERVQRLVFGEDAELYDRARPHYPARMIDDIVALPGGDVHALDAGCGTGKATVLLAARGVTGVGVEPHAAMAAVARRNLEPYRDRWSVVETEFESYADPTGAGTFDLVIAAQSWHWMDPKTRLERAHALLRPGGWLALFWNRAVAEPTLLRRRFDELYASHAPHIPSDAPGGRLRGHGDRSEQPGWHPTLERTYAWSETYTRDHYLELMASSSDHRLLEPDARDALLAGLGEAIDEIGGGRIEIPYTVALWCARRT